MDGYGKQQIKVSQVEVQFSSGSAFSFLLLIVNKPKWQNYFCTLNVSIIWLEHPVVSWAEQNSAGSVQCQ